MADEIVEPPIAWDGLRPAAGGPRHYQGPEVGAKAPWKCPACFQENTGVLEQGCVHCGNGGGAKHVGVDPIVVKVKKGVEDWSVAPAGDRFIPSDVLEAFANWVAQHPTEVTDVFKGFKAGWQMAQAASGGRVTSPVTDHPEDVPTVAAVLADLAAIGSIPSPEPTETPQQAFPGTVKDRTLLAALEFFRDQLHTKDTEEVRSGEWLSVAELAQWITETRARLDQE